MTTSLISLTPADAVSDENLQIVNLDLNKALAKYEDTGKGWLTMASLRINKSAFKLLLTGELTTNGISCTEFGKVMSYSFGFRFENEDDLQAFEKLNELIISFLEAQNQTIAEWDITNVVKDDKIYIKLKTNQKKTFQVLSNVKIDPKRLQDSGLYRGQKVEVVAELGIYFNLNDKKAGITLSPRRLSFDIEEEEPNPKRVKKE
jgi:hypothetical protein